MTPPNNMMLFTSPTTTTPRKSRRVDNEHASTNAHSSNNENDSLNGTAALNTSSEAVAMKHKSPRGMNDSIDSNSDVDSAKRRSAGNLFGNSLFEAPAHSTPNSDFVRPHMPMLHSSRAAKTTSRVGSPSTQPTSILHGCTINSVAPLSLLQSPPSSPSLHLNPSFSTMLQQQPLPAFSLATTADTTNATVSPASYRRLSISTKTPSASTTPTSAGNVRRVLSVHAPLASQSATAANTTSSHSHSSLRIAASTRIARTRQRLDNDIYKTAPSALPTVTLYRRNSLEAAHVTHSLSSTPPTHPVMTPDRQPPTNTNQSSDRARTPPRSVRKGYASAASTPYNSLPPSPAVSRPGSPRASPKPDMSALLRRMSNHSLNTPANKRMMPCTPTSKRRRQSQEFGFLATPNQSTDAVNVSTALDASDGILYHHNFFEHDIVDLTTTELSTTDFQMVERIGHGSYAEVVSAKVNHPTSRLSGQTVALKEQNKAFETLSERRTAIQYINHLQRLSEHQWHPAIVEHYAIWQEWSKVYVVNELCAAGDCSSINAPADEDADAFELDDNATHTVTPSVLTAESVLQLVHSMASALQHLHSHGMIHMDVKPSNIFRTADGQFKLGDLANMISLQADEPLSADMLGDGQYLAPEALRYRQLGFFTDIYALGLTLYVIITNAYIVKNEEGHPQLNWSLSLISNLPSELTAIIDSMCAINPQQRPTAQQLVDWCQTRMGDIALVPKPAAAQMEITSPEPVVISSSALMERLNDEMLTPTPSKPTSNDLTGASFPNDLASYSHRSNGSGSGGSRGTRQHSRNNSIGEDQDMVYTPRSLNFNLTS